MSDVSLGDISERQSSDMSDFDGVSSDNDDDILDFSNEAAYLTNLADPMKSYIFYSTSNITERIGAEGPNFRLLRIRHGSPASELHCDLVKRPMYEAGIDYSAISYSWGQGLAKGTMSIGFLSQKFDVTHHLLQALRRMRNELRPVYVWVDAICINQKDLDEKAAQIPLMAQIFNQAKEVIVWLGEGVMPGLPSLLSLCTRPNVWWTRLWVLQETLYAASEPMVLLESGKMSMSELLDCWRPVLDPDFLNEASSHGLPSTMDPASVRHMREGFDQISQLRDAWMEQSFAGVPQKPLMEWIRLTLRRHCTERIDRIYALLNVIPEKEARHFQPDYRKSSNDLFREVIDYYLHHTSWQLPALQQLVDDLHGDRARALYLRSVEPTAISYESLTCPREPKRASGHIFWRFITLGVRPTLSLYTVASDKVLGILRARTADQLHHEIIRCNLWWNEGAIKQALTSYFKHVARLRDSLPDENSAQLSGWSAELSASEVGTINADWSSYLGDNAPFSEFHSIFMTVSGVVGIQLPRDRSHVGRGEYLYFTASGGLGHVARDRLLTATCFVAKTEKLDAFIAAHSLLTKAPVDISLPNHACMVMSDPSSISL
ncbi:hypothetical protein CKM354_000782400 [Cercospora kikuchii]|uniref:Heterokaryon incompatibility domain-containing protein n=1 Tax=Cercospora kikuchii TaxID=84275 RepID=A0A9P3CNH1_9PEZI|nr:uncharacterized protein CKM354_000782400 [Cercospora kikuchii]GIZ44632.1 hypothetical protein CKM354_000782400 [Cercospora kikuchii]